MKYKSSKKSTQVLIDILCKMSDQDLDKMLGFHQYHAKEILIQKKVRREEKLAGN